jgi:hypothetical protein
VQSKGMNKFIDSRGGSISSKDNKIYSSLASDLSEDISDRREKKIDMSIDSLGDDLTRFVSEAC